jgi:hypothetical protein
MRVIDNKKCNELKRNNINDNVKIKFKVNQGEIIKREFKKRKIRTGIWFTYQYDIYG